MMSKHNIHLMVQRWDIQMQIKFGLRWGDFVIVIAVLVGAVLVTLPFINGKTNRLTCEIKQGDQVIRTIRLAEGYQDTVVLTRGQIENIIQIDGTKVYFSASTCPDQVCVRTGVLSRAGQMAVCLPGQVVVRLIGTETEVDAVAGR